MTKDYTTVRVEKAAKSVADDAKTDDETWSDYIRRCADAEPSVQRLVDADAFVDELPRESINPEWLADAVADRLSGDVPGERADEDGSVSLDAAERRAIAEEVAEVLR